MVLGARLIEFQGSTVSTLTAKFLFCKAPFIYPETLKSEADPSDKPNKPNHSRKKFLSPPLAKLKSSCLQFSRFPYLSSSVLQNVPPSHLFYKLRKMGWGWSGSELRVARFMKGALQNKNFAIKVDTVETWILNPSFSFECALEHSAKKDKAATCSGWLATVVEEHQ